MRTPLLLLLLAGLSAGQEIAWPGPKPDGSTLLPNGWSLRPHGRQIGLVADMPVRMEAHPDGRHLAIQHAGYREHEVVVLDGETEREVARLPIPKSWSGLAWSADGRVLHVSGGVDDLVHRFACDLEAGAFTPLEPWAVGDGDVLDLPAGMCADGAGGIFVVLQRSHRLTRLGPDGAALYTVDLGEKAWPFECRLASAAGRVWVSCWGRAEVLAFDAENGARSARVATGEHPCEMVLSTEGDRLFVGNANENTVTVIDTGTARPLETLCSALYPSAPPGSTPNSVALSPNGSLLLVANADNNLVAVLDVSTPGESQSLGYVPVGWYPTSVRWTADGRKVFVANAKGSRGSRRNPGGPAPDARPRNLDEYTGAMFTGSLSAFEWPSPAELQTLSARAYACSPLEAGARVADLAARPADSPIPAKPGGATPITHVVYIIKENRTYDQILGDDPRGNGDPELCLFPEKVTPNHHALAREFVLLDNFYVEAEVSADGHEWTMGAYATDFVERTWPVGYGGKGATTLESGERAELGYPSEGQFEIAFPKGGYLFDIAAAAGISFRSYGEFTRNGATFDDPSTAAIPVLEGHVAPAFRGYDMRYEDVKRARAFLAELEGFEAAGELPRLIVMRLPNDHTFGTRKGRRTPRSCVADNDLALGMVLEGLSESSFWKSMAVFVLEDDAQNGPDHVDAHRSVAFLAGPYVRRGVKVSTMYSTCSMLRTIELVLGLPPMSQFDAAARPMYACFTSEPDFTPYRLRPATWPLDERNTARTHGAERSEGFDFSKEDAADDIALNEVIWKSIKGADSPMPLPRRAAFVRTARSLGEEDEEDDEREEERPAPSQETGSPSSSSRSSR